MGAFGLLFITGCFEAVNAVINIDGGSEGEQKDAGKLVLFTDIVFRLILTTHIFELYFGF